MTALMIRLGTVMTADPLSVRRDGDTVDIRVRPTDIALAVSDRVLTVTLDNVVYIIVKVL